jgi:hypothetical protein
MLQYEMGVDDVDMDEVKRERIEHMFGMYRLLSDFFHGRN